MKSREVGKVDGVSGVFGIRQGADADEQENWHITDPESNCSKNYSIKELPRLGG